MSLYSSIFDNVFYVSIDKYFIVPFFILIEVDHFLSYLAYGNILIVVDNCHMGAFLEWAVWIKEGSFEIGVPK